MLNSFVPPFPGRAFERAFENLLSDRRFSPVSAFLAVTAECPYACGHCSAAMRRRGYLSTEAWHSAIAQLHGLGASIIGLTGGEPVTRPDLPELVRAVGRGGAESIVFTSGAGVTEAKARELADAGLWAMCVSLDSPHPAEHDRLRGHRGAFDDAVQAVELSRAHGFYTMIGAVATRSFVEQETYRSLHALARRLRVDELRIVEPMPCGRLREEREEHLLTQSHIHALRRFHRTINHAGRLPKVCAFNQIESPEVFGCAGGIQHLYVDSAGNVCPCDFTPLSFGNLTEEPLAVVWRRMIDAMGRPRRHCIVQKHHALFDEYAGRGFPVPPPTSIEVAARIPPEPLPDYYAMVLAGDPRQGTAVNRAACGREAATR